MMFLGPSCSGVDSTRLQGAIACSELSATTEYYVVGYLSHLDAYLNCGTPIGGRSSQTNVKPLPQLAR